MQITLNGQIYELKGGVNRQPIIEWPDNIRLDGQQLRKDRRYLSSWEIDDVSQGLGKKEDISGGKRLWDVENVDTRFSSQKILSPALVTCTVNPSRGDLSLAMDYLNDVYFFQTTSGNGLYKFTAPNSLVGSSNLTIGSPATCILGVRGVKVLGANIILAAIGGSGNSLFVPLGSLGDIGTSRGQFTTDPSILDVKFADIGGTIHALAYDETSKGYGFYIIPRLLGSLVPIGSITGVVGTQLSPLVGDGPKVYANLPDGVWDFDDIPAKIIDSGRSIDLNPNQVMFQNYLYFKNKYSTMKYDGVDVVGVGYDREDGLPSDKMGEITAYASTWRRIFAAVKGATYSHILTYDGAWQYYTRWPTAGIWIKDMFLSAAPDGIDRLWCIPGNYAYPGYFLNPMINPLQAATYGYVPSGYYTPPIYGGGMPEITGGFLRMIMTSDNLNGTQDARIRYGLDGAIPSNILGLVGSKHSELVFGSPAGIEAYRIQPQIELFRNSALTGTTPIVRETVLHYLKDPPRRYIYDFEVDLEATARARQNPIEAIIGSLNYVANIKILSPFWYGQIATTYVKVMDQPASENIQDSVNNVFPAEREGFVRVRVGEIL